MPTLDTCRKQAKLLMRWHSESNYSLGERVRRLARFRSHTDRQILDMPFPLALAQEVIAAEAGHASWADLKQALAGAEPAPRPDAGPIVLKGATPILFVRDVTAAAAYYRDRLGFAIDFLHGQPAFYGAVSRDGACLHLRHVHRPSMDASVMREENLIVASIEVDNVKALFAEIEGRGAIISQPLTLQAWGGTDFWVRDLDGNDISFVSFPFALDAPTG